VSDTHVSRNHCEAQRGRAGAGADMCGAKIQGTSCSENDLQILNEAGTCSPLHYILFTALSVVQVYARLEEVLLKLYSEDARPTYLFLLYFLFGRTRLGLEGANRGYPVNASAWKSLHICYPPKVR